MRILSSGDWHYCSGLDDDVDASVQQIIDYLKRRPVDLVAITGDVFERASDPKGRNPAAWAIQKMANIAPVLIVRGNHDAPGDLLLLQDLKASKPIWVDEAPQSRRFGDVAIQTAPWLTKSRFMSHHPDIATEEADQTVSQLFLTYLRNQASLNSGYKNILVGHLTIAGARAQNHQQLGADGVCLGMYDLSEAGYYASILGHIHLKQTLNNPLSFYNGSITALDYGESPQKYFSVLDTSTEQVDWILLNTVHRQDVTVKWSSTGLEFIGEDSCKRSLISGARVRINLRIEGGDNTELADEAIEKWSKEMGALEWKVNRQVITTAQVRSAEVSKAQSMRDKLQKYWEATEKPDEKTQQRMLECLSEIEEELCSQSV